MARIGPAARRAVRHIGFKAAVEKAREGGATNPAGAIASAAQTASPEAKRRNPRLTRVAGVGKKGKRGAGKAG